MKKKVVSALLCATMVATMFAGCGSKNDSNTSDKNTGDTSAAEIPACTTASTCAETPAPCHPRG